MHNIVVPHGHVANRSRLCLDLCFCLNFIEIIIILCYPYYGTINEARGGIMRSYIKRYWYIVFVGLSFYLLDLYLRFTNLSAGAGSIISKTANLFTIAWISIFLFLLLFFRGIKKKIVYISIYLFFLLSFLINYFYHSIFGTFFTFKAIGLTNEGHSYFSIILNYFNPVLIVILMVSILFCVIAVHFMPKDYPKKDKKFSFIFFAISILSFVFAHISLGPLASKNEWNTWAYKRNTYNDFTDSIRNLQTTGLYEYTIRDIYLSTVKNWFKDTKEEQAYLDNYFANDSKTSEKNEWTGKLKGKNIIIVLMESIDSWLVTKGNMPTVYNMMKEGINFSNHFSPIYVSGATFNSEFMINTGYMTPLNKALANSTYGENTFKESLAELFKSEGYNDNFFHMNYGSFYNRAQMAKDYGYNHYYSSLELGIPYNKAVKDSHLMTESNIRNLILPDDKFMDFIITYSAHTPYTINSINCSANINDKEGEAIEKGVDEETLCIQSQAHETDNFFKLLIENLKNENKLDNTVIIGVTDHFAYAYTNRDKIRQLKNSYDDNFLCQVPFFIWSDNLESLDITKVNTNLDVLPTIANLFGLNWNPKYYLGQDILDDNYDDFVFFPDYSWYDGDIYYRDGLIKFGNNTNKNYIDNNKQISNLLTINKYVLDTDYFKNK